jgi:hypothetical protein
MQCFISRLGTVELTDERKNHILTFHPEIHSAFTYFSEALSHPNTIRQSKFDTEVILFYKKVTDSKYLVIVVKVNQRRFILTAYFTEKIKHKLV